MSANSKIEWTDHTGGPWLICTEVSPGCANCYSRELMLRRLKVIVRKAYKAAGFDDWETRPVWGKTAPRVLTKGFWSSARTINRKAEKEGKRVKWFPSLIDWLDDMPAGVIDQEGNRMDPTRVLADFLALVEECRWIDWLLLTKRPELWMERMEAVWNLLSGEAGDKPCSFGHPLYGARCLVNSWLCGPQTRQVPSNIWLGATVENQAMAAKRIPVLMSIPVKVRFLSCEPLLGPVDLRSIWDDDNNNFDALTGDIGVDGRGHTGPSDARKVHWVIAGGESGPQARPMHPDWVRSLRDQCQAAGTPFLFKQWGEWLQRGAMMDRQDDAAAEIMARVGKKSAGRLLDGVEWNDFPNVEP